MWYVLQTITGREEALAGMIRKLVPKEACEDCFVVYYERVWRRQQRSIVHVERLFPGYVFAVTDNPRRLFLELKQVPALAKLLSDGSEVFLHLDKEEEQFLLSLLSCDTEGKTVRLSYVQADRNGHIYRIEGPLRHYASQVDKYQYKKRYAVIRFQMFGHEKTAALGILLDEDLQQGIAYVREGYGQGEAPAIVAAYDGYDRYKAEIFKKPEVFAVGDYVRALNGMSGTIRKCKAGNDTVTVGVRLFGQEIMVEVPVDEVCKEEVL